MRALRGASKLAGRTPIPKGTSLALGLSKQLETFAESKGAVSVFGAWDKGYHGLPIADDTVLKGNFADIVGAFTENGGRVKFDLTGLETGIEGVTTWELRQVLGNSKWEAATDFFRDGERLSGEALEQAVKPWR